MSRPVPPKTRKDFDIAIICALQLEANAVEAIFDRFWDEDGDRYGKSSGDKNAYRTGVIGNHNVVLAYMPVLYKNKIMITTAPADSTTGAAAACMRSVLEQWAVVDKAEQRSTRLNDPLHGEPESPINSPSKIQSSRVDEGYHSQNNYDSSDGEITQVLPRIENWFKSTLSYFKENRKCLPRDVDLRKTLKTQRVIFASNVKCLPSDSPDAVKDHLGSSKGICLQAALEIEKKFEQIQELTKHLPAATKARKQTKSETEMLKHAIDDLKSLIQVFVSSIPQTNQPLPREEPRTTTPTRSRHEFQHFHIVQQAACSLYDAIGTACNLHTIHDVHLSLQPDLDQTSTRVRFDVAFAQHSMKSGNAVWINVESIIKSVEQIPRPVLPPLAIQQITGIPNLYLQRNFCTVVERSLHQQICNGCIGLLGDNEVCKHLAYLGSQTDSSSAPRSLSQLVSISKANPMNEMGTYERVRLARYLATAVLYYHATPWLKKVWSSKDVYFFDDHDTSLQKRRPILPYVTASVQAASSSARSQARLPDYHHIIRNPVLFGLGVMFLELAFQAPLGTLQEPIDLEKGETWGFVEYFTAHRVVEQSHSKVSTSFKKIIKQCLHCDFGHDSDFTSPALQQAFYKDVISVLEDLEELFRDLQIE
ncbi:uncharacterized protein N7458_009352 [Penicillium daleae]|uniref:DUF7580 domain-containing protein n=1 Tax=Penicillium daleae TaxID=63821 RepID=A0AAD6BZJ3_9EURO|nr:uncharacterized protein N7458_009352 [Penicillium daleae]KAJ5438354.1 hypothetical protein N7458_009352 [Penicillium daleae]